MISMFSLLSKAQMQEIKSERIASLQVVAGQDWLEDPVIRLGGGQRINISFDELTHDSHRYTYTITHCEPDWSDSADSKVDRLWIIMKNLSIPINCSPIIS